MKENPEAVTNDFPPIKEIPCGPRVCLLLILHNFPRICFMKSVVCESIQSQAAVWNIKVRKPMTALEGGAGV